jgi:biopolymer transport protein ExbD
MRRSVLQAPSDEAEEINLTPMLDVVFIMLIFFIVTASFIKEAGIEVTRPAAETAARKENASILIAISPGNEIWIDRKKVEPGGVRPAIEKLLAENPEGQVVVQADKESYAESLLAVMDAARAAGVANVSISAEED